MRYGTITCDCSQSFYFETENPLIKCIRCDKEHDVTGFPKKGETKSGEVLQSTIDLKEPHR